MENNLPEEPKAPSAHKFSNAQQFIECYKEQPEAWYQFLFQHQDWSRNIITHYATWSTAVEQKLSDYK